MADAGYSSRSDARRGHDLPCLVRGPHSLLYHSSSPLAADPPRCTEKLAVSLATVDVGGRPLDALCAGADDDADRLAVRVVSRLVVVVFLSRAVADAGLRQRGSRQIH